MKKKLQLVTYCFKFVVLEDKFYVKVFVLAVKLNKKFINWVYTVCNIFLYLVKKIDNKTTN